MKIWYKRTNLRGEAAHNVPGTSVYLESVEAEDCPEGYAEYHEAAGQPAPEPEAKPKAPSKAEEAKAKLRGEVLAFLESEDAASVANIGNDVLLSSQKSPLVKAKNETLAKVAKSYGIELGEDRTANLRAIYQASLA